MPAMGSLASDIPSIPRNTPSYSRATTDSSKDLYIIFFTAAFESLLTGIFLVLTFTAVYLWSTRSHGIFKQAQPPFPPLTFKMRWTMYLKRLRNPLFYGTLILLVLVFAHWICIAIRLMEAVQFIRSQRSPIEFYQELSHPTFVAMSLLVSIAIPLVDLLLIWRLWVVSGRSNLKLILPPIATVIGFFGCAIRVTVWFAFSNHPHDFFDPEVRSWILANTFLTAFSNIYCSVTLGYYIHRISSRTPSMSAGDNSKAPTLAIIMESAAIHSIWSILTFITYQIRSTLALLVLDTGPVVAGIAFMLINVRVGLGWDVHPCSNITPSEININVDWSQVQGIVSQSTSSVRASMRTPSSISFASSKAGTTARIPQIPTIPPIKLIFSGNEDRDVCPSHMSSLNLARLEPEGVV